MRKYALGFVVVSILWTPTAYASDALKPVVHQSNCSPLRPLAPKEDVVINGWVTGCTYRLSGLIKDNDRQNIFANGSVTYSFVLTKDGNIDDLRKDNSSGNLEVENRALEILKQAVPFSVPKTDQIRQRRVKVVFDSRLKVEMGDPISK